MNSVTQHGSDVTLGGNLNVSAGRDVSVIASEVKAGGDITIDATENLIVASAADEYHQYSYRKRRSPSDLSCSRLLKMELLLREEVNRQAQVLD